MRRVTRNGQDVRLTHTEWGILELLVRNPEKLVTQQQLLTEIWGVASAHVFTQLRIELVFQPALRGANMITATPSSLGLNP